MMYSFVAALFDYSDLPNNGTGDPTKNAVSIILNIVFSISASIALLIIVIGGFRYIVAHGDPGATASAKNSILYALVGLVIVITAYAIVVFVVKGIS